MAIVTLEQAKQQLQIPPTTTDRDVEVQTLATGATGVVLDYLKSRAVAGWSDETVAVPAPVQQATLLLIGHYYQHRGDDLTADAVVWMAVKALLDRSRDPAYA